MWQYYVLKSDILCAILKIRLWDFQNGKMSKNSSKIDQYTAKTVKRKILKNNSFCLKVVFFLTKTVIFQKFTFYCFCCILVNFWAIFAHFTILEFSKSYLFKKWHTVCLILASKKVLRNENMQEIFYATDSSMAFVPLTSRLSVERDFSTIITFS